MPTPLEEFLTGIESSETLSKQQKSGISFRARNSTRPNNNDLALRGLQRRNLRKKSSLEQMLAGENIKTIRQARDISQRSSDIALSKSPLEKLLLKANIDSINTQTDQSPLFNLLAKAGLDLKERNIRGNQRLRGLEREDNRKLGLLDALTAFKAVEEESSLERLLNSHPDYGVDPRQDALRNLFLALIGTF